jgi:preprotein translocase, YajC subunit
MILAAAPGGFLGSTGGMIVMMAILFGAMYFMMIRPQKQEQKRVAAMLADMQIGDAIVTTSGFYGIIIDITDEDVIVEFGSNKNCRIPMRKGAIAEVEKLSDAIETAPAAKSDKK